MLHPTRIWSGSLRILDLPDAPSVYNLVHAEVRRFHLMISASVASRHLRSSARSMWVDMWMPVCPTTNIYRYLQYPIGTDIMTEHMFAAADTADLCNLTAMGRYSN